MIAVTEPRPLGVLTKSLIEKALSWEATHLYVEQENVRCRLSARLPDHSLRELDVIPQDAGQRLVDDFEGLASLTVEDRRRPQHGCIPVGLLDGERSFPVGSLPFMDTNNREKIVVRLTTAPQPIEA